MILKLKITGETQLFDDINIWNRFSIKRLNNSVDPGSCRFSQKNNTVIISLKKAHSTNWDQLNYKDKPVKLLIIAIIIFSLKMKKLIKLQIQMHLWWIWWKRNEIKHLYMIILLKLSWYFDFMQSLLFVQNWILLCKYHHYIHMITVVNCYLMFMSVIFCNLN